MGSLLDAQLRRLTIWRLGHVLGNAMLAFVIVTRLACCFCDWASFAATGFQSWLWDCIAVLILQRQLYNLVITSSSSRFGHRRQQARSGPFDFAFFFPVSQQRAGRMSSECSAPLARDISWIKHMYSTNIITSKFRLDRLKPTWSTGSPMQAQATDPVPFPFYI
jgi:hypothetical protein